MKSPAADIIPLHDQDDPASETRGARLLAYLGNHRAVVDTFGDRGPLVARCLASLSGEALAEGALSGVRVGVVFEHGDPLRPIVTELVDRDHVGQVSPEPKSSRPVEASILADGQERALSIEAGEELVLRCGEASITLKRDGTIVVEGSRVETRASETNRITGAQVRIN